MDKLDMNHLDGLILHNFLTIFVMKSFRFIKKCVAKNWKFVEAFLYMSLKDFHIDICANIMLSVDFFPPNHPEDSLFYHKFREKIGKYLHSFWLLHPTSFKWYEKWEKLISFYLPVKICHLKCERIKWMINNLSIQWTKPEDSSWIFWSGFKIIKHTFSMQPAISTSHSIIFRLNSAVCT